MTAAKQFTLAYGPTLAADYAHMAHTPLSPEVYRAYHAFKTELRQQWHAMHIAVSFVPEPAPYPTSADMFEAIDTDKRLRVFQGGELPAGHPLREPFAYGVVYTYNDVFRAVHDYFGHYLGRYSFGPIGEESAFRAHACMFSALAVRALATETRGQNSWVNYGPYSHLPANVRPFAEQKAGLLPAYAWGF